MQGRDCYLPMQDIFYFWATARKGKVVPEHAKQALGVSTRTALPIYNLDTRRIWVDSAMPRLLYTRETDTVPIILESGWVSEPVCMGLENFAHTGVWIPDRPFHSESL